MEACDEAELLEGVVGDGDASRFLAGAVEDEGEAFVLEAELLDSGFVAAHEDIVVEQRALLHGEAVGRYGGEGGREELEWFSFGGAEGADEGRQRAAAEAGARYEVKEEPHFYVIWSMDYGVCSIRLGFVTGLRGLRLCNMEYGLWSM